MPASAIRVPSPATRMSHSSARSNAVPRVHPLSAQMIGTGKSYSRRVPHWLRSSTSKSVAPNPWRWAWLAPRAGDRGLAGRRSDRAAGRVASLALDLGVDPLIDFVPVSVTVGGPLAGPDSAGSSPTSSTMSRPHENESPLLRHTTTRTSRSVRSRSR